MQGTDSRCGLVNGRSGPVRVSKSLCAKEEEFIKKRKEKVESWLRNNDIIYEKDHVPVIAVLGSGGGQRAMVGLLGCLAQMGKENLLNSALYLCGVSGSTWCMPSLYRDPRWSLNLPSDIHKIIDRLSGPGVSLTDRLNWLLEAVKDETYSLTDFWAATVVCSFVKEINQSCLSEQEDSEAVNPYPIYTAIDQGLKDNDQSAASWFELSPHEAGYTHLGAFVETKYFGSKFEGGEVKEHCKEKDMLYLQGLCGSAIAGKETKEKIKEWIWKYFMDISGYFTSKHRTSEQLSSDKVPCDCPVCTILCPVLQRCDGGNIDEEISLVWQTLCQQRFDDGYIGARCPDGTCGTAEIMSCTMTALKEWTWGTKHSFLKDFETEDVLPDVLLTQKIRHLEDAGLFLNSPYIPVLRPERNVDLILSFDFSEGDPFLTVEQATDYCKHAGIAFPSVAIPENDGNCPNDFYLFKDKADAPTVIHIPLFNHINCGGQAKVEDFRKKYKTFQRVYGRDQIEEVLKLSAENVINNARRILHEIKEVCKR